MDKKDEEIIQQVDTWVAHICDSLDRSIHYHACVIEQGLNAVAEAIRVTSQKEE